MGRGSRANATVSFWALGIAMACGVWKKWYKGIECWSGNIQSLTNIYDVLFRRHRHVTTPRAALPENQHSLDPCYSLFQVS